MSETIPAAAAVAAPDTGALHPSTGRPAGKPAIAVLMAASCMPILGAVLLSPVLPTLQRAFADTPGVDALAPLVLTAPALLIALLAPFAGRLVDAVGRKRLLVGALAVYAVVASPIDGADPTAVFVASMAHHLHNAAMPDSGFSGEVLLGGALDAVIARARDGAQQRLAGVGVEERARRPGREVELDVLVAPAPLVDERQGGLAPLQVGQRVGAVRGGDDPGARAVGDGEAGGAGVAAAVGGVHARHARAPVDSGVDGGVRVGPIHGAQADGHARQRRDRSPRHLA